MLIQARTTLLALCLGLGACKGEAPAPKGSSSAPAPSAAKGLKKPSSRAGYPLGSTSTIGFPMQVLPGQGIGPIRFGATFDTVERHMTRPCDERSETRCLYVHQAVDFTMKDGVVSDIYVVRRDRPAPPTKSGEQRYFGTFFGRLATDIALGLHKHVVDEELRAPDRVEKLPAPDANGTVERYYYDGLVLEFDKLENGATVLAAMRILPSKTATDPVKAPAPSASAPASAPPPASAPKPPTK